MWYGINTIIVLSYSTQMESNASSIWMFYLIVDLFVEDLFLTLLKKDGENTNGGDQERAEVGWVIKWRYWGSTASSFHEVFNGVGRYYLLLIGKIEVTYFWGLVRLLHSLVLLFMLARGDNLFQVWVGFAKPKHDVFSWLWLKINHNPDTAKLLEPVYNPRGFILFLNVFTTCPIYLQPDSTIYLSGSGRDLCHEFPPPRIWFEIYSTNMEYVLTICWYVVLIIEAIILFGPINNSFCFNKALEDKFGNNTLHLLWN